MLKFWHKCTLVSRPNVGEPAKPPRILSRCMPMRINPPHSIHSIQSTPSNPLHSTGKDMPTPIRKAVADMGTDRLGFTLEDCGTHSIRSAAAMAMHMASVPAYTILTIGHSINPFQSIQSNLSSPINTVQSIQSIQSIQSTPLHRQRHEHSHP